MHLIRGLERLLSEPSESHGMTMEGYQLGSTFVSLLDESV